MDSKKKKFLDDARETLEEILADEVDVEIMMALIASDDWRGIVDAAEWYSYQWIERVPKSIVDQPDYNDIIWSQCQLHGKLRDSWILTRLHKIANMNPREGPWNWFVEFITDKLWESVKEHNLALNNRN